MPTTNQAIIEKPVTTPVHIELVKVKDLPDFARDFFAHPEGQVTAPIAERRALAQSRNPNADANDIGLMVAYDGRKCVGYRGILPGILKQGNQTSKIHWASSLFVLPEYRKQKLGQVLVQRWTQLGDVGATGSTDAAMGVYQRCGFHEAGPLQYIAIKLEGLNRIAAPFRALQRRAGEKSFLRRVSQRGGEVASRLFDASARAAFYRRVSEQCDAALRGARFTETTQITAPLAPHGDEPHFHRSLAAINWMIANPWFSETARPSTPPCYFSDVRELFRYQAFEFQNASAQPIGFVVLLAWRSERRSVVKLLDHHCPSTGERATAFWLGMRLAAQHNVERIELPLEFQPFARELPSAPRIVSITERRYYLNPIGGDSPLARARHSVRLNFCDSDLPFY
jgi:GNAT superfamily N-acetyltransferase